MNRWSWVRSNSTSKDADCRVCLCENDGFAIGVISCKDDNFLTGIAFKVMVRKEESNCIIAGIIQTVEVDISLARNC